MAEKINRDEQIILEIKVSELYYLKGYDQGKIASILGCSRAKASRLLDKAIKDNIVEIKIRNPIQAAKEIENCLMESFPLQKAVVVHGKYTDSNFLRKAIGVASAQLAANLIEDGDRIGICSGRTIYEMIGSLSGFCNRKMNIEVVPLLGGYGLMGTEYQINELVRLFGDSFGGSSRMLNVPFVVDQKEAYDLLLEEKRVKEVV